MAQRRALVAWQSVADSGQVNSGASVLSPGREDTVLSVGSVQYAEWTKCTLLMHPCSPVPFGTSSTSSRTILRRSL